LFVLIASSGFGRDDPASGPELGRCVYWHDLWSCLYYGVYYQF